MLYYYSVRAGATCVGEAVGMSAEQEEVVLVNNENLNGHHVLTPKLIFAIICRVVAAEAHAQRQGGWRPRYSLLQPRIRHVPREKFARIWDRPRFWLVCVRSILQGDPREAIKPLLC